MPPDFLPPDAGSPEDWLGHARSDLALAEISPPPGVFFEALCFHAQQAAEKAIKAVLIREGMRVPKIHGIAELLGLVQTTVPAPIREAGSLTLYAALTRYPGDQARIGREEWRRSTRLAGAVVEWAEGVISGDPA